MVGEWLTILLFASTVAPNLTVHALTRRARLPNPISLATAKSYLSELTVAEEVNIPPYRRKYFKHWIKLSGPCDTRDFALIRDGSDVVSSECNVTSGSWYSEYDGLTWTLPSDVDIDHVVPLKEAWVSGARLWDNTSREIFANDLERPQLLTVTDNINQAKGDQDLAEWLPPREEYQCEYVRAYIEVKHFYNLSVDSAEKAAASHVLGEIC